MAHIPGLALNNGREMPIIGLGTWQGVPGEVDRAVEEALDIGYRHFDCALAYENEDAIGTVLKAAIDGGQVTRDELFVTTKLPPFVNEPVLVRDAFHTSLDRLKVGYIDLYLIHHAVSVNREEMKAQGVSNPFDPVPNPSSFFNFANHLGVWRELEKLVDEGLVKAIGLSNFNKQQIQHILDNARIKPASLQIECHAYLPQSELVEFCQKNGIVVVAYSPLGAPARPGLRLDNDDCKPVLLQDAALITIAERNKKTPAQILLHFLIQRNIAVLPKSVRKERLEENFNVFNFNLSQDELADLKKLGQQKIRYIDFSRWKDSPDYPFEK